MGKSVRDPSFRLTSLRAVWWYIAYFVLTTWMKLCYRIRVRGARNIPRRGPVLFVSNHQSYLDPIIVGVGAFRRPFFSLARATLFDNRIFGAAIRSYNAIPVEQGAADTSAMRKCIEVLKNDQALLIFPEGARTEDGQVHEFAPGTMLLIKRARPVVVPVAVQGAYDVWRRGQKRPRYFGRLAVHFGEPITADELMAVTDDKPMEHLRKIVQGLLDAETHAKAQRG